MLRELIGGMFRVRQEAQTAAGALDSRQQHVDPSWRSCNMSVDGVLG